MNKYPVSREFMDKFAPQYKAVNDFVSRKIGTISRTITAKDAYFGSSPFIDLIHQLQLEFRVLKCLSVLRCPSGQRLKKETSM